MREREEGLPERERERVCERDRENAWWTMPAPESEVT